MENARSRAGGLRASNQFDLKWTDVDLSNGIITARATKSGETYRIPMNETVREILRGLPSRLRSEFVFPSATGKTAMASRSFRERVFRPALEAAKINDFHWHDLRHSFASRLVMAGVDLKSVQELMGHKTLAMTLRYAHLSPAHKLDAVCRLDRPTGTTTGTGAAPGASELEADTETLVSQGEEVGRDRIELSTQGFSVPCSTD